MLYLVYHEGMRLSCLRKKHIFFRAFFPKTSKIRECIPMSAVKKACICSFCVALCYVLPTVFHMLALGSAFSPMHIPVLLCGLVCGWPYGAFCGIAGPILSSLTGMPSAVQLLYMVPELCAYGLFAGLFAQYLRTGQTILDLELSLLPAMLLGRVVGGLARALFYLSAAQRWSVALWASSYLLGTLPGAILHLTLIPVLVTVLMKSGLIPPRYTLKGATT
jgi:thiamine transporter ThiT